MFDYPENIAPVGIFQERYCYNEAPSDTSYYYSGPQYQSGYEGSRRNDIDYRVDVNDGYGLTENPFDRRPKYNNSDALNPWAQSEPRPYTCSYQDHYPSGYFEKTMLDKPTEFNVNQFSRRNDIAPMTEPSMGSRYDFSNGLGMKDPRQDMYTGSGYGSYEPYGNNKPQDIMPNGYSYNNPYASALGMEVVGFDRKTSENWDNRFVEERPIRSQLYPWSDYDENSFDNRYQAFQSSLQPSIPTTSSNDDEFLGWEGYAERNFADK